MNTMTRTDTMKSITTHYVDGAFVESHGRQVMDIIRPTDGHLIGHVTLADEEDTRRAVAAAKRAFASYGGSRPEERAKILRRLHEAASARVDDLTAAMIEEYGGVARFAGLIVNPASTRFWPRNRRFRRYRGPAAGTRPRSPWNRLASPV
jgi:aldehyde dehydrogenase (NAD+)